MPFLKFPLFAIYLRFSKYNVVVLLSRVNFLFIRRNQRHGYSRLQMMDKTLCNRYQHLSDTSVQKKNTSTFIRTLVEMLLKQLSSKFHLGYFSNVEWIIEYLENHRYLSCSLTFPPVLREIRGEQPQIRYTIRDQTHYIFLLAFIPSQFKGIFSKTIPRNKSISDCC